MKWNAHERALNSKLKCEIEKLCGIRKIGTKNGGLSPWRIRQPVCQSASVRPGGLRRTQADSEKVCRVHLSSPRIGLDPIGSAINWRTVRQKKVHCSVGWQKTRPESANWRTLSAKGRRRTKFANFIWRKSPLPSGLSPRRNYPKP